MKQRRSRVTKGKRAPQKSRQDAATISDQRLNLVLASAQMGIWELDLVNDTAFRNLKHDQIFGYQTLQPEWGYEIFLTHVVPEDRQTVQERFAEACKTGDFNTECRIIWADKSIHWIAVQGRVFRDDGGNLAKMMGTVTDVTERKRTEEELGRFFTLSRDLLCISGFDGYLKRISPSFERTLGYTAGELLSEPYMNLVHPDDRDAVRAALEHMSANADLVDFECRVCCKNGSYKWFSSNATPYLEQQVIYSTARDITERKRIEEALRRSEQQTRLAIETSFNAFVSMDSEGRITDWNRQAEIIFGWPRDEAITRPLAELIIPRQYREAHRRGLKHFLATGEGPVINKRIEITALHRDGREFPVELAITPLRSGDSYVFNAFVQDITERKRAEDVLEKQRTELSRFNTELVAANKELEVFTYSVSHDLRAPLRHISGFCKILEEDFGPRLDMEAQRHLQRIHQSAQHMGQLVDDLLSLGRVSRQEMNLQITGLNTVVAEVISELGPEAGDRQVDWQIARLPFVECDPGLIRHVFANLLSNSLKYTRPRERAVIEVGQQATNEGPVIFIRDNGVGFNMKYADKLFGVFQRLHRKEDFEGTGVGLAIAQRIIHKHGGRIWAEAQLDQGAAFYFTVSPQSKGVAGVQSKELIEQGR